MTWAATTDLTMLAIANWSSTWRSRTPSAFPVVPLQVPLAVMTVADMPPPPVTSCEAKAAWSLAANALDTGSSLMAVKAATGKAATGKAAAASERSGEADGAIGDVVDVAGAEPEGPQAASANTSVN